MMQEAFMHAARRRRRDRDGRPWRRPAALLRLAEPEMVSAALAGAARVWSALVGMALIGMARVWSALVGMALVGMALVGMAVGVSLVAISPVALAQDDGERPFLYVNELGDTVRAPAAGGRSIHVTGVFGLETAGYFRGVFDDVPEDLDSLQIGPTLRLTVELPALGALRGPTATVGTGNNFWTNETAVSGDGPWFENDNFVGLATGIGQSWQAGLTYTFYGSPNGASADGQELALSARQTALAGEPQVKAAIPVDGDDGVFLQIAAAPGIGSFSLAGQSVSLAVPLELGIGIADYYGEDIGTSGYAAARLALSAALPVPARFGSWALTGGFAAILRPDELAETDPVGVGAGNLIAVGLVGLAFVY
jgi:hypothetical protein